MKISIRNHALLRKKVLLGAIAFMASACMVSPALATPRGSVASLPARESNAVDQPAGTTFAYLSIAGSTFHPRDSNTTTTYSYPGGGCIAKTGGSDSLFVHHKAILPGGAVVRYVRLYYYNTSTSNVEAFFATYDGAGNYSHRTSVSSAGGASSYDSSLSPDMNYSVDPFTSAINVVVNLGDQNDETLQFCGVRIAYEAPILDRIFVSGFETLPL
ncbi:MAG: hypothetical protein WBP11_00925 [Dokdonella sp.]